ncbi:MAG TPA: hypothetical protein VHO48_12190 [Anaerolineaceae bacterium]|nr:hypothetical protein [Anaerolineaceae bacterium]
MSSDLLEKRDSTVPSKRIFVWIILAIGAGIALVCLAAVIFFLGFVVGRGGARAAPQVDAAPDAVAQLNVEADGCGISRGEVTGSTPVSSLTWVITDADGNAVLERKADGEYRYRYFAGGEYWVHLKAWYDGRYWPVSAEVTIRCP